METCKWCGRERGDSDLKENWRRSVCSGYLTHGTDPFAEEIHGDYTLVWMCEGQRHESMMEI